MCPRSLHIMGVPSRKYHVHNLDRPYTLDFVYYLTSMPHFFINLKYEKYARTRRANVSHCELISKAWRWSIQHYVCVQGMAHKLFLLVHYSPMSINVPWLCFSSITGIYEPVPHTNGYWPYESVPHTNGYWPCEKSYDKSHNESHRFIMTEGLHEQKKQQTFLINFNETNMIGDIRA